MSGDQEYDKLIKFIDNEITNLKTAHERPLGALDFFHYSKTVTVNLQNTYGYYYLDFWLDVTIKTPDATPPIVQTGWNVPSGFVRMDLYEYAINADYTKWSYRLVLDSSSQSTATFKVSVVSSLPIVSIGTRSS